MPHSNDQWFHQDHAVQCNICQGGVGKHGDLPRLLYILETGVSGHFTNEVRKTNFL